MPLSVRPLHPVLGAEIEGVSISGAVDAALAGEIRENLSRYGVLRLRGQSLSDVELEDFALSLGEVYKTRPGEPGLFRLSNLDADGNLLAPDARARRVNDANQLWHTDSTYLRPRAAISFLYSQIVPATGGDTEFCDTRRAWDDLEPELQNHLAPLSAQHSVIHSRTLTGFDDWSPAERAARAPIERPLVHVHPETGRRAICLAAHICWVSGYTPEAGQALIDGLIERATRRDLVFAHQWRVGDLLLWDNRCTMHRARPYDEFTEPRDMRSVRTVDLGDQ